MEEDLQEPDNYLEDRNQLKGVKPLKMLRPIDIHTFATTGVEKPKTLTDRRLDGTLERGLTRGFSFKLSSINIDTLFKGNYNSRVENASDNSIIQQYQGIASRLNFSKTQRRSSNERQERFFDRYKKEQGKLEKLIKTACSSVGREPHESIISKSRDFRETVERRQTFETTARVSAVQDEKRWYVGLRNYSRHPIKRPFILPCGNTSNGLWMRITDSWSKPEECIRIPIEGNIQRKVDLPRKSLTVRDNQSLKLLMVLMINNIRLKGRVLTI